MVKLRVGIAGLRRGRSFFNVFGHSPRAEISAVCDNNPRVLEDFMRSTGFKGKVFDDYSDLVRAELDLIVICTPAPAHASNTIDALRNGKHVLSEVPAAYSLDECREIVRTVRSTGLKYMMAENCCYFAYIQSWKEMAAQGRFGKIIYAESDYVHDCRDLMRDSDGRLTWRASMPPIHYCTHSLGPLLDIMDDRCVTAVGFNTGCNVAPELGAIDMEVGIFRTAKGGAVKILCGFSIAREPALLWHGVYGTKGCVESKRCGWDQIKGYFEDVPNLRDMISYPIDIGHPKAPPEARLGGHGTSEYFLVRGFMDSIINDTVPPIDVYRSMDYTAPGICAHISAESDGMPVEVPDFREIGD